MEDDLPLHKDPLFIFTIVFILAIIGLSAWNVFRPREQYDYQPREESVVRQITPHFTTKKVVLAILMDRIIKCESDFDPKICNQEFGCRAGMGLAQLIPSTVKYCEEKLGKHIDPFDPDDNYECAMYLLETDGTRHWGTSETWWGSYDCWFSE